MSLAEAELVLEARTYAGHRTAALLADILGASRAAHGVNAQAMPNRHNMRLRMYLEELGRLVEAGHAALQEPQEPRGEEAADG